MAKTKLTPYSYTRGVVFRSLGAIFTLLSLLTISLSNDTGVTLCAEALQIAIFLGVIAVLGD